MASGTLRAGYEPSWELFGVYSGRIDGRTDIGRVWKMSAIREILEAGVRSELIDE